MATRKLSIASAKTDPAVAVIVDQLGLYNSQISSTAAQADDCKATLIEVASKGGNRSFEGRLFNATVSFNNRSNTDWEVFQQFLLASGVEQSLIDAARKRATRVAEGVPCVRVTARKAAA